MAESPRIDELRQRLEKDPTSIAFAQLAEEYRRAGNYEEAVRVCRSGLARHPAYLSARVTLGRALTELERLDEAQAELDAVLAIAADNLAAIRALADILQRRGDSPEPVGTPAVGPEIARAVPAPPPRQDLQPPAEPETLTLDTDSYDVAPANATDMSIQAASRDGSAARIEFESAPAEPEVTDADLPAFAETAGEPPVPAAEPLSALEALDALAIDLPPLPEPPPWNFDLPPFELPADLTITLDDSLLPAIERRDAALEPAPIDEWAPVSIEQAPPDPALEELEQWLGAIVKDRSER